MKKIILASGSPRRREILTMLGADFEVVTSDADERNSEKLGDYARRAAEIKAEAVHKTRNDGIILAADTIVCIDGHILGKPKDEADAENMLKSLSGRVHSVYTGFCVIDGSAKSSFEKTDVCFKNLTPGLLSWYLKTGEWRDKAGAYGIQGAGSLLIERIDGDYFNVVGLPVSRIFGEYIGLPNGVF